MLLISACAVESTHQQSIEEVNMVQLMCQEGLAAGGVYIDSIEKNIPARNRKKITSLLIGAEIDRQFGNYPGCLNRLERAYYFLSQITPDN
ncbi:MAG: hypothetical protein OEY07_17885 [Gammaproteobacteria bacterium]|nr:hypothetical protein [Gammaproteobacteria bacterium]